MNEFGKDLFEEFFGLANARIKFWTCPVRHPWPDILSSRATPTVEWADSVAQCLWRGCGRRSDDPVPRSYCACEEYDCRGECCGAGQCSCSGGTGE